MKRMDPENNPEQFNRAEDGILSHIWDALLKVETLRSMDMGSFSIDVEGGEVYLKGYLPQQDLLPLIESTIYSVVGVLAVHNHLRTNDEILADICNALGKEDLVRFLDIGSLSIKVENGEVSLTGHLMREKNRLLIESIARSSEGVVAVHNNLVVDRQLVIDVAQALVRDERTRLFTIPVSAFHGWIQLGGEVPTREIRSAAEKIALEMPGVRGVITLPGVAGEIPDMPRLAVQPRIGAVVYSWNRDEGVITQVVIQPKDRLVTHIIVRFNEIKDTNLVARETVVPVKAIDLVKNESIFLVRNGQSLNAYPAFDPDEYPLAPFTWKAPYPYTAGEVLWSLREILGVASQPGSQPETEAQREVEGSLKLVMAQAGS